MSDPRGAAAGLSFSVTVASSQLELDERRQGTATYSVTNRTGWTRRGRMRTVPLGGCPAAWLRLAGEAERAFEAGATLQFPVEVGVPADAAFGAYTFRLDAIGVDNPDEDYTEGPSVSFEVRAAGPSPALKSGYVAVALGTLLGAVAGGVVGLVPGAAFALARTSQTDLRTVTVVLGVGGLLGYWLGGAAGGWMGLQLSGYVAAFATATLLVAFLALPLAAGVVYLLAAPGSIGNGLLALVLLLASGALALAARALVLRRLTPPRQP